jgi:hypothetical protein
MAEGKSTIGRALAILARWQRSTYHGITVPGSATFSCGDMADALLEDRRALLAALELIEVDLTAGDMPAKTRVALALDRVRAALSLAKDGTK